MHVFSKFFRSAGKKNRVFHIKIYITDICTGGRCTARDILKLGVVYMVMMVVSLLVGAHRQNSISLVLSEVLFRLPLPCLLLP